MDLVLHIADEYLFDSVWARLVPFNDPLADDHSFLAGNTSTIVTQPQSAWPRDHIPRQLLSLIVVTLVGIHLLYFIFAGLSFRLIFNHDMMRHPRFLKNQIRAEILSSLKAFPGMTLLTLPWFQAEVMGYSKLYDDVSEYGWFYLVFSVPLYASFLSILLHDAHMICMLSFLVFTDYLVYWVHRTLHHPMLYKTFHKPHHKWIIPTPFASHAFHPVDGYLQSVPYHLFIFLFPLHRWLYLGLFVFVNFWSILIHDSDMITGHPLEHVINGPAHHTLHHLYFTVNYGQVPTRPLIAKFKPLISYHQYFTWADRAGGSYRQPESHLDPSLEIPKEKTL
ncbi:C5-sterol desaturase [Boletus reticuloceps]|uniref:C5-sterol desaturase n=1 Tax=Boletus reticuloceps TaxID=495285 RepID=A0A8I3A802_9AGAM|nr:C5-sterol desaturase [Boletus reticuloceps]